MHTGAGLSTGGTGRRSGRGSGGEGQDTAQVLYLQDRHAGQSQARKGVVHTRLARADRWRISGPTQARNLRETPLGALAAQARALGAPLVALDPERRLLPALQEILLDPGIQPAWINRQHPRNSLRFNLLAVAPTPAPGHTPEGGALHLALTSALPLFEEFLARLGLAPWSTTTGGIFVHDLVLGLLLAHHRARLVADAPRPAPTPATLYQHLRAGADLRPLLDAEYQAWRDTTLAHACGRGAAAHQTYTSACTALEAGLDRWAGISLTQQHAARDPILDLLQPLWEAPGFQSLWQGTTAPGSYFNEQPPH